MGARVNVADLKVGARDAQGYYHQAGGTCEFSKSETEAAQADGKQGETWKKLNIKFWKK